MFPIHQKKKRMDKPIILYGGIKKQVEEQLKCNHDWHDPCIDSISRYFKCTKCFAMERDCTLEEYYERMNKICNYNTI